MVLDKYSLGKEAYTKDNYVVEYGSPDKLTSRKVTSAVFYLKTQLGWDLDRIIEYFTPKINEWYWCGENMLDEIKKTLENAKRVRYLQIKKEYNREYNLVEFCQREIDLINKFPLNTGRLMFLILCICKQYGYKHFTFAPRWIRDCYNGKIDNKSINLAIHKAHSAKLIRRCKDGSMKINEDILSMYDGNPAFQFFNIGNISLLFDYVTGRKKNVIFCECCGVIVERTGNRQKYCFECWKDKQKILWRDSKQKSRNVQV